MENTGTARPILIPYRLIDKMELDPKEYRLADRKEVYSDHDQTGHNPKPTLMYCQYCKYQIIIAMTGTKCCNCHSYLITYIPKNELAG